MSVVQDHPSVGSRMTPRSHATPKRSHHHKYETDNVPSQHLKVGYQKVILDIDLAEQSVLGETELMVLPLDSSVRQIKLDCRGMQIKSVTVNNRKANYKYGDFFQNDEYLNDPNNPVVSDFPYNAHHESNSTSISISQHHLYRAKFYPLFSDQNNHEDSMSSYLETTSELVIFVPESIKLRLQDSNSKQTFSPNIQTAKYTATPLATNTLMGSEKVYTPLNVKITYTVKNSKNGLLFHGGKGTNIPKSKWFCYTSNNDLGCSASSWVPCIDTFHNKPAWDINIVVPKTIGDIGEVKIIGTKEAEKALRKLHMDEMDEDEVNDDRQEQPDDEFDEVDDATPIVVAVPDLISSKESPHNIDIGKKVINFQFYNPVSPHHLGFAVGAFEKCPLVDLNSSIEDTNPTGIVDGVPTNPATLATDANSNKVPTMFYYLPGKKDDVLNTTVFLYKALDFYSKEFGSFPFTSYTMVFIQDMPNDVCGFAGMTIVNDRLLYGPSLIEPIYEVTETLSVALSEQYSGINVLPKSLNDIWCTIGISYFMAGQFLKKLFGVNHYRYEVKQKTDLLCELDVGKRPLANQLFRFPLNSDQDFKFLKLKAPLVLFILDRRMTKTDKSFGLSRVIPKIFLQAMSSDLYSGNCLSTAHFQHVCEKVALHKLESFFQNWVHNSGVPVFRVTQKFNKKRNVIEMSIRQVQKTSKVEDEEDEMEMNVNSKENIRKLYQRDHFVDEANRFLNEEEAFDIQNVFTGPITIRIHEADGTPYEHIVDIKDAYTKLDIQYNTKYRRTKRRKDDEAEEKEREKKKKDEEMKVKKLGDVLTSSAEIENWQLKEEAPVNNESNTAEQTGDAFEWLRVDADFEWICKLYINQNHYMFESQLRQDRDVEAQIESIKFFSSSLRPPMHYATVLLKTLVDKRYFHGVRAEAAQGLALISKEENDHLGMRYLLKAFKHFYCYNNMIRKDLDVLNPIEYLPLPNDFSEFSDLFIMRAITGALSVIKNKNGDSPIELKNILLNILKYNDNTNNDFDDTFYISHFLSCLTSVIVSTNRFISNHNESVVDETTKVTGDATDEFLHESIIEMNRCLKMDHWLPSYQSMKTATVIKEKIRMASLGLINLTFVELIQYTKPNFHPNVRLAAFEGLLTLGGLKNSHVLALFFAAAKIDPSLYIRFNLISILTKSIGVTALEGTPSNLEDKEFIDLEQINSEPRKKSEGDFGMIGNTMVIIEENYAKGDMKSRRDQISRSTMKGAVEVLRRDLSIGKGLKKQLWEALHSCLFSINSKRNLFDVAQILYEPVDSFKVTTELPSDKKVVAKVTEVDPTVGKFTLAIKRQSRLKIQIPTIKLKVTDSVSSTSAAKPLLKIKNLDGPKEPAKNPTSSVQRSLPPPPTMPPIKIPEPKKKFEVTFKYRKATPTTSVPPVETRKRVGFDVIKTDPLLPLRYVKLKIFEKKILVSTDENFGEIPLVDEKFVVSEPTSFKVSLKIRPEKLKSLSQKASESTPEVPIKEEPTQLKINLKLK